MRPMIQRFAISEPGQANSFYAPSFDPPRADRANEYHGLKVIIDELGLAARSGMMDEAVRLRT
jgi:hypothetical protein